MLNFCYYLPPSLDSLVIRKMDTFFTDAATISSFHLTNLLVSWREFAPNEQAIHALLRNLPSTLTTLSVFSPSQLPTDLTRNWPKLKLTTLAMRTSSFFQSALQLPSTVSDIELTGLIPTNHPDNIPSWPFSLRKLSIEIPGAFVAEHMFLWSIFPPTLHELSLSARSFAVLPKDWSCLKCVNLVKLRVCCDVIYDFNFNSPPNVGKSIELKDGHLKNLPPNLRTLAFTDLDHSVTAQGFFSLPTGLHCCILGDTHHKAHDGELKTYFQSIWRDQELYLRPHEASSEPIPARLIRYVLSRRYIELLCSVVPNVDFVVPQWPRPIPDKQQLRAFTSKPFEEPSNCTLM